MGSMGVPSDRPTMMPAYDVAQFAKDSDSRVATAAPAPEPTSEVRLVGRSLDGGPWHEEWARSATGNVVVALDASRLFALPLDHRAGFLLSRIDGTFDLETLLEISSMPRAEALVVARELFDLGVIDFR